MYWQQLGYETLFFIVLIIALTVFFHSQYNERTAEEAPTILTTLGIFATFFAIAVGLFKFDASNIQESVPALLDSMKTAFWASVFGVGGALTFKVRGIFSKEEYHDDDITRSLLKELRELKADSNQRLEELRKDNNKHLEQARVDSNQRLDELRKDTNDRLNDLTNAQKEAFDKIAKSSSDDLVNALKEVIKDFNAKINEQFGDNFKELNQAVGELLVWQKQYKEYIETSTKTLTEITQDTQKVAASFGEVVSNSSAITDNLESFVHNARYFQDIAESLENTLSGLDSQRSAIQEQLSTLSMLVTTASNDLPDIGNQVLAVATTMRNSANEFNSTVAQLSDSTKNQTEALTNGIEEALSQSLTTLGGQLTAMTEKFASDYDQLANALARISTVTQSSRGF